MFDRLRKMARLIRARGRSPVHLLHIPKTGGTAVWHALETWTKRGRYDLIIHPHATLLRDVPKGERVAFFLRDPVTRFVSAFYSRQRQGRPHYNSPWSPGERRAFERFESPDALAVALAPGAALRAEAEAAMDAIHHMKSALHWLSSEAYLLSRLPDLFHIGFQETLGADFERLKVQLVLPRSIALSDDAVVAHKNPAHLDYKLSDAGVAAVEAWYAAERSMYDLCRKLAPTVNAR